MIKVNYNQCLILGNVVHLKKMRQNKKEPLHSRRKIIPQLLGSECLFYVIKHTLSEFNRTTLQFLTKIPIEGCARIKTTFYGKLFHRTV